MNISLENTTSNYSDCPVVTPGHNLSTVLTEVMENDDELAALTTPVNASSFVNNSGNDYYDYYGDEPAGPDAVLAVYILLSALGLCTNAGFIFTVLRVPHMRSVTNHYLLNLSIADFLYCLQTLVATSVYVSYGYLPGNQLLCPLLLLSYLLPSQASILTIMLISIERYVAICHPFAAKRRLSEKRAAWLLSTVWLLALAISSPFMASCRYPYPQLYFACDIIDVVSILLPLLVVCILYSLVVARLSQTQSEVTLHTNSHRVKVQVVKMLIITTAVFFLCLFPFMLQALLYNLLYLDIEPLAFYVFGEISLTLFIFNSVVNPLIYVSVSSQHRQAVKTAFGCSRLSRAYKGLVHHQGHHHIATVEKVPSTTCGPPHQRVSTVTGTAWPRRNPAFDVSSTDNGSITLKTENTHL